MNASSYLPYRILSAALMIICAVLGAILIVTFVRYTLLPAAMVPGPPPFPTNYWGFYMTGFAGALLITWAAFLLGAVLRPSIARAVGTATAFGLTLNAFFRMAAWFSGEYAEVGNLPRIEAVVMLILAIGFIWLRPPRDAWRTV